jgi:uncharacterized protein (DUF1684 family)
LDQFTQEFEMSLADRLSAIRERLAEATTGPWREGYDDGSGMFDADENESCITDGNASVAHMSITSRENTALIAHAPSDLTLLLAVCAEYERALRFYSNREHMSVDARSSLINYDYSKPDWRIGAPYTTAVEYGQVARAALAAAEKMAGE